jgi:hypothetical protein
VGCEHFAAVWWGSAYNKTLIKTKTCPEGYRDLGTDGGEREMTRNAGYYADPLAEEAGSRSWCGNKRVERDRERIYTNGMGWWVASGT